MKNMFASLGDVWQRFPFPVRAWLGAAERFVWLAVVSAALEYPFTNFHKPHAISLFLAQVGATAAAALRLFLSTNPLRNVIAEVQQSSDGSIKEVVYGGKKEVDSGRDGKDGSEGDSGQVRKSN